MKNVILRRSRRIKQLIQIVFDGFVLYFAYIFCYVHNDGSIDIVISKFYSIVPLLAIPVSIFTFFNFGLYRSLIRYMMTESFPKTIILFCIAAIIFWIISIILDNHYEWTHFVTFILISSSLGLAGRFWARSYLLSGDFSNRPNVIIYGAKGLSLELLTAIKQRRELMIVGLVDDDPELSGILVAGVRVYGMNELQSIVSRKKVSMVLVAMSEVTRESKKYLSDLLKFNSVQIKQIPAITDILSGRVSISQFKTVKIEDLLGRKPVPPIPELMEVNTSEKSVLVTGAGGSIGSEICRQLLFTKPACLTLLDQSELGLYRIEEELLLEIKKTGSNTKIVTVILNICNENALFKILKVNKVETVFHAAAYKHVPLLESNVYASLINNVLGTRSVVKASIAAGVKSMTMISTDKAVRPTNVMGASKRFAELICQVYAKNQYNTTISMVRFGNVLDSSGSVIPLFRRQIVNGGPVTVTHRQMTRYFMTIPEASQLVIQASSMATYGEIFLLDMGSPILILDLAKSMIRLSGYEPYLFEEDEERKGPNSDQVEIKFSRLRPGEKLYEELLISDNSSPTNHPRIMKADEQSIEYKKLNSYLKDLETSIEENDVEETLQFLKDLPLNFIPTSNEKTIL